MVNPNPIIGSGLHAIGGISAASCYTPFEKVKSWSWNSFWLIQAMFAWLIMPVIIGLITVPDFFGVLKDSPPEVIRGAFILGAFYGFGGMSFGFSIRYIGFSLTYTIAIGISAVFGTLVPLIINGTMNDYFTRPGSNIVLVKEWRKVSKITYLILILALLTLVLSFVIMTYGSTAGERALNS